MDILTRLLAKVLVREDTGCWEWQAGTDDWGYGTIRHERKDHKTHRLMFTLKRGVIGPGLKVLHRCDNPKCCNPEHLFLGTHADNMADMVAKGRQRPCRGELQGSAKLTAAQVREIREKYKPRDYPFSRLAQEYGVSKTQVRNIVARRKWSSVK